MFSIKKLVSPKAALGFLRPQGMSAEWGACAPLEQTQHTLMGLGEGGVDPNRPHEGPGAVKQTMRVIIKKTPQVPGNK